MLRNNINVAIEIVNDFNSIQNLWKEQFGNHPGGFYGFMTTPSVERERFVATLKTERDVDGSILRTLITR